MRPIRIMVLSAAGVAPTSVAGIFAHPIARGAGLAAARGDGKMRVGRSRARA